MIGFPAGRWLHPLVTTAVKVRVFVVVAVMVAMAVVMIVERPAVITTRSTTRVVESGAIRPRLFGAAAQHLRQKWSIPTVTTTHVLPFRNKANFAAE